MKRIIASASDYADYDVVVSFGGYVGAGQRQSACGGNEQAKGVEAQLSEPARLGILFLQSSHRVSAVGGGRVGR